MGLPRHYGAPDAVHAVRMVDVGILQSLPGGMVARNGTGDGNGGNRGRDGGHRRGRSGAKRRERGLGIDGTQKFGRG